MACDWVHISSGRSRPALWRHGHVWRMAEARDIQRHRFDWGEPIDMRSFRKFLAVSWMFSITGVALAQQADFSASVPNFTVENVAGAAKAVNFQTEMFTADDGAKYVGVTATNGMKFLAEPTACQKPNHVECYGLAIYAVFDGFKPTLEGANTFNKKRAFTKAYVDGTQA